MIIQQLIENLKSRLVLNILIILAYAGGLFLSIGTASYYQHSVDKLTVFVDAYSNTKRYVSFPNRERLNELLKDPQSIDKLTKLRKLIYSSNQFEACSLHNKGLYITDFCGPDKMLKGYENGDAQRDIYFKQSNVYFSEAKAFEIDTDAFQKYAIKVEEGNDFSDFKNTDLSWDTVYPVVLGWDYKKYYSIGDKFTALEIMGHVGIGLKDKKIQYKVVGFLESGSAILSGTHLSESGAEDQQVIYLGSYILTPMFVLDNYVPQDAIEQEWKCLRMYNRSQSQTVLSTLTIDEISPILQNIGKEAGFSSMATLETMKLTSLFLNESNEYFALLRTTSIFIMISAVICLTVNLINKLIANFKKYSVHLISGSTMNNIQSFIIAEVVFVILVANLIAYILALTIGGYVFSYSKTSIGGISVTAITTSSVITATILSIIVIILTLIIPLIKLRTTEFDSLLRGRE